MEKNDMVIVSVDDHIVEPADMFEKVLSGEALATAPKMLQTPKGASYWEYQGIKVPGFGLNAVVGRPLDEYGSEPTNIDQVRKGVWDVHERVKDMDINGVAASMNFSSWVGFDGGRFHQAPNKVLSLIHLKAYNDWHVDHWCGAYPGRFIPLGLLPTWDMDATVAEIERLAAKGVTAVALNENPTCQGLPSIHNAYWEPLWKAIVAHDMVMCLHIGAGNPAPHASMETPIEAWITTMPMSIAAGASDWMHLEALRRYPTMKIALSEGGIGWIPYFMERADFSHARHKAWTHSDFGADKPSDIFKRHFLCCFIDDIFGLQNLRFLNEDLVAYESDYPHSDSLWPEAADFLWDSVKHLPKEQLEKVTHKNAMKFFNFDLFKHFKREEVTVGALRAKAAASGVDTTLISSGGAKPLAPGETPRTVTSGDLAKMFADHEKAA